MKLSRRQEQALRRSQQARLPSIEVAVDLYRLIRSGEWKGIWEKNKRGIQNRLPRDVIETIEEAISKIPLNNKEAYKLRISEKTNVTILLGAGASVASGIPTVNGLLDELWKRARHIGRDDLDQLADWCNQQGIKNIEDLLTTAFISDFAAKNSNVTALLDYFLFSGSNLDDEDDFGSSRPATRVDVSSIGFLQDTLQTVFSLLASTMIPRSPNPLHKAIAKFTKEHLNTTVITTNYDGLMDEALLKAGFELNSSIPTGSSTKPIVNLIKMHGSINWSYCDSCQDTREFDLLKLKEIFVQDQLSYPVLGICKICGGLRRPLLVPPLSFKFLRFPNLIDIWNSARERIEEADYLIVIGYSFAEADTYITKIISRSLTANKKQVMIVVNPDHNLVPSLRSKYFSRIDNFDQGRILAINEQGEVVLPKLLASLLGTKKQKKGRKSIKQLPSTQASTSGETT